MRIPCFSKDMQYILDFDRTLFDTDACKAEQVKRYGTDALGSLQSLEELPVETFLFEDALDFLQAHDRSSLHIVSSCAGRTGGWDTAYQRKKLEKSGVAEYVAAVHLVFDQKIKMIRKILTDGPAVFVDDMFSHLTAVQRVLPEVQPVHIARSGTLSAKDEAQYDGIPTIEDLTELDTVLYAAISAGSSR